MDGRKTRERERERERAAGSRALPIIAQGRIAQRSRGANSNRSPKRRSRLRGERKLLHRRHSARRVRTAERGDWSDAIGDAAASVHSVHAFLYISLRAIRDASLSLARRASPSLFSLSLSVGHKEIRPSANLRFSNLIHFPDSVRAARRRA
jgi:hypothetical protein